MVSDVTGMVALYPTASGRRRSRKTDSSTSVAGPAKGAARGSPRSSSDWYVGALSSCPGRQGLAGCSVSRSAWISILREEFFVLSSQRRRIACLRSDLPGGMGERSTSAAYSLRLLSLTVTLHASAE